MAPKFSCVTRASPVQTEEMNLASTAVGSTDYSRQQFLENHTGLVVLPTKVALVLMGMFYKKVPMGAFSWGRLELARSGEGRRLISWCEKHRIYVQALAWERVKAKGAHTFTLAESLPDSFFEADIEEVHLIGDPFRCVEPCRVQRVLLHEENTVGVPWPILEKLRGYEFWPDQQIPLNEKVRLVEKLDRDNQTAVVVPTWADSAAVKWATAPRFMKDSFLTLVQSIQLAREKGCSKGLLEIIQSCIPGTAHTSLPLDLSGLERALTGATTLGDIGKELPSDLLDVPLDEPTWKIEYAQNHHRVRTVYSLVTSDYVFLLPPPDWWNQEEKAWYLYRATTSTRTGLLINEA